MNNFKVEPNLINSHLILRGKTVLSNLFRNDSKSILGIDIGTHVVRVLELSQYNGHHRVEAYGQATLADNAVVEQSINDASLVAQAISAAVAQSGSRTKRVAVAVSGSSVISKQVYMPQNLSDEDMDFQIRAEADQYIPYPLEDVALDWEIQNPEPNAGGKVEVLLSACRQENITRLEEAVRQAGLELTVVDVESFCLERAFEVIQPQVKSTETHTVAIFDIGMDMISMCILNDGKQVYTREQMTGMNILLEDMQRHYGVDQGKAIAMIKQNSLPENFDTDVLAIFQETISEHISRALQFFYSSSTFDKVDYVVLGGHFIEFSKLARSIQNSLGIPAIAANSFANMTLAAKVDVQLINTESQALLIATGLALRSND